jgi:predicted O-linked N-acetylglucosamine transferase (SPINDLY family)
MTATNDQTSAQKRSEFERAVRHHQAEEFSAAEALYEKILALEPRNGAVLNLCGVVRCQRGDIAGGIALLERSIASEKTRGAYRNLGLALQIDGRLDDAVAAYRSARDLEPQNPQARLELGDVLRAAGRAAEALTELRAAIDITPGFAEAHHALGGVLSELGREAEAQAAYGVALDLKPDFAQAQLNLATLLHQRRRLEAAHDAYAAGLALEPDAPNAWAEFGGLLQELARPDEARDAFRKAYAPAPETFAARWNLATCHLQPLYRSEEEIDAARAGYDRDLHALAGACDLGSAEALRAAADALARRLPFYLPAQGGCDRDLQQTYGALVCRVMQALYPRFAARPALPPVKADERIRVGIASSFIARHSVWKIPVQGWVENLDRARFALHGYFLGSGADDVTELAGKHFARFTIGPLPVGRWAELMRADDLHVLIFPEIGMDGTALQLAALRLAAVQAVSLGHPETSGLPSIDYFLSSALMENATTDEHEADAHYTERLVRLPNLGVHYAPPPAAPVALTRADLGLRADATVYWCCQALHKYLPQHDRVFPRIAARVPGAQFVFIRHANGATVNAIFEERLARAFAHDGLSLQEHCVFLQTLDFARFNAVARLSDVFLDSIGWSGFNSTLESLAWDLPAVVLPGTLMRTRHSAAVMTMMAVTETIAADIDGYVEIAARLGNDRGWRQAVASRIRDNKHKVLNDMTSVRALEDFLIGVAK